MMRRKPADVPIQRNHQPQRRDTTRMEMGLAHSGSRPKSIRHIIKSRFSHDATLYRHERKLSKVATLTPYDQCNLTASKRKFPDGYLQYIANRPHKGAFHTLVSYYGYIEHPEETASEPPQNLTWYDCLISLGNVLQKNNQADFELLEVFFALPTGTEDTFTFMERLNPYSQAKLENALNAARHLTILEAALRWNLLSSEILDIRRLLD
ncbi:hypothetical protein IWZ00DRAFT_493541 [Phyllosticta capitalensis]|uniref:Uncharacterized protein n=1 Tax=Phyllosticta capitalensis TaxID=121624 RepID=A0ABR1YD40_9PEZI